MRSARLDATDWRILHALQADGRITNVDLARKVGISAPACLRRARALEEAGIIKGFAALLNDKALGFEVTAFAMIRLHSQAEADLIAFEERARSSAIVRDCYMLSGEIDFLLRCVAPDLSAFQDFIIHELTAAPNVASVKTSLVIRASKHAEGVPVELVAEAKRPGEADGTRAKLRRTGLSGRLRGAKGPGAIADDAASVAARIAGIAQVEALDAPPPVLCGTKRAV